MVLVGDMGTGWGAVAPKVKDGVKVGAVVVVGGNGLAGGGWLRVAKMWYWM